MNNSRILKGLCYLLIPILILVIGISIFYQVNKQHYLERPINTEEYFKSDEFLNLFMTNLSSSTTEFIYNNSQYRNINDGDFTIYYADEDENTYYYDSKIQDLYYVIIYKNKVFTDVELTAETDTLTEIKEFISKKEGDNDKFANFIKGQVESDSEIIKNKAIQYFYLFENKYYTMEKSPNYIVDYNDEVYTESVEIIEAPTYYTCKIEDLEIYSSYKENIIEYDKMASYRETINSLSPYEDILTISIPMCSILLILIIIYLVIAIGHVKDKNEIDINDFDKVPIEIIFTIAALIICGYILLGYPLIGISTDESNILFVCCCLLALYFMIYIALASFGITLIKRIKARTFVQTSIIVKIIKWCWNLAKKIIRRILKFFRLIIKNIKKLFKTINENVSITIRLLLFLTAYIAGSMLLVALFNGMGAIIVLVFTVIILLKIIERINCYENIEKHLKDIYNGNYSKKLDYEEFTSEFQNIVKYVNDVSSGFEKAIEEGIKSEKLKAELITNVSHDIKTPLTSIINYVDLLKKENIENEKAKEYIEVLDNKSQRLKKLTEDLVEASKASSGNVKLKIEKINVCELIKQATGEFEDKFKLKDLDIISSIPNEEIYIDADNRYMYRIIENLFSNISKYALDSSRVYIDVKKEEKNVKILIKNISKEKLNISADELMQRFIRGDKSRTTEGSGLGISISKSLTEIQKGDFNLIIDGDLFKVELTFEIDNK